MANANPMISLVLRLGMSGPSVARVQQLLKERGYTIEGDAGFFGSSTEDAVRDFQSKASLRADGIVGPEVWRALEAKPEIEDAAAKAMAAAHARAEATARAAEAVGALPTPVEQAQPMAMTPYVAQVQPNTSGLTFGKALVYGGLALLGLAAARSWFGGVAPLDFNLYEDDYGLPPVSDDDDDDDASASGGDPGGGLSGSSGAAGAADTGIVPFGGGPALKRGPGGKFLPRGGRQIARGS